MPQINESFKYQPETESFKLARISRPDIAITICFELDDDYIWDGCGEEPETPAYVVTVTAYQIKGGLLFEGNAYLGGCYPLEDEILDFEVGGYASQMIHEAISDLETDVRLFPR